jgi:hypothetical protein
MTVLLGAGLLFVVHAALVPSPPVRTLALTSVLGLPYVAVPFFFAPASVGLPVLRTASFPVVSVVACADFGGWTEEAAREWWEENAAATAPAASGSLNEELTLTRRLDSPG